MVTDDVDAIVLAGGRARRMDGADKPLLRFGGRPLVRIAVEAALAHCRTVTVVGPPLMSVPPARLVREDPPFGGPVAGLAAAMSADAAEWTLVLAADLPYAADAVTALLGAPRRDDGICARDAGGRVQWLQST